MRLWLVGLAGVAALIWMGQWGAEQAFRFAEWVQGQGAWAGVVFTLGYAVATVAWIPGMVLTLSAGVIFEPLPAVVYVFVGSSMGSALAFVLARYAARDAVERRFAGHPRLLAIDRAVGEQGLRVVFLLRLSPFFPFTPLNYVLGLTRVRLSDYLLASFGMLPGTVLYVYSGRVIGDLAAVASGVGPPRDAAYWTLLVIGLGATIGISLWLARIARGALASEIPQEGELDGAGAASDSR